MWVGSRKNFSIGRTDPLADPVGTALATTGRVPSRRVQIEPQEGNLPMRNKKARIFSAVMGAGLIFGGATAAIINTGHESTPAALAAKVASSPPVNLDNCPVLAEGYQGGCINQLQTELNADNGTDMPVDGIFGPDTKQALITFQDNHDIVPADGIVGPQTKAVLDNPGSSPVAAAVPAAPGNSAAGNAASANAVTPAPPVTAPGPNAGRLYVRVCGTVTCSVYYSHQATVRLAAKLAFAGSPANVLTAAGLACSAAFAVINPPAAAACISVGIAALGSKQILDTIDHAAATAGCVSFRSLDGISFVPVVYADHSAICHSMDS